MLFKAADLIEARSDEIIKLQSLEMGGPIGPAHPGPHPMIERSAWNFRFFAEEQELAGNESFNRDDSLLTYTMRDAAGVFGLITPWNGPFMLSTWKMAPCLAYGNSAVHKPSELSPLSIRVLCEIFQEAGMPAGVYNMVLGYGAEAGVPLVEHKDVVGVSFTGSVPTARDIAARAAKSAQAHVVRTRRQVGEHHFCGRESQARDAGRGDVDLHERGPGVRRRFAHPRAATDLSSNSSMVSRRPRPAGKREIRSTAPPASVRSSTNVNTIA